MLVSKQRKSHRVSRKYRKVTHRVKHRKSHRVSRKYRKVTHRVKHRKYIFRLGELKTNLDQRFFARFGKGYREVFYNLKNKDTMSDALKTVIRTPPNSSTFSGRIYRRFLSLAKKINGFYVRNNITFPRNNFYLIEQLMNNVRFRDALVTKFRTSLPMLKTIAYKPLNFYDPIIVPPEEKLKLEIEKYENIIRGIVYIFYKHFGTPPNRIVSDILETSIGVKSIPIPPTIFFQTK